MLLKKSCFAYFKLFLILFFFKITSNRVLAQESIILEGQAYDKDSKLPLPKLMVINKTTNQGVFADAEGRFLLKIKQSDTLILSAIGFNLKQISLVDSVTKSKYNIAVPLEKLHYTLKEISVFANRTLSDIDKDIANLDSAKTYSSFKEINGLESPITYLYMRFSKFGRSKMKVAAWENEDLKRDILKDLFRLYIKHDIIDLNEEEFDAFIKYCNLSEEFIKTASQLELIMAIKGKYENFKLRWH